MFLPKFVGAPAADTDVPAMKGQAKEGARVIKGDRVFPDRLHGFVLGFREGER